MSTLAVNTITNVAGSLPPVFPAGSAQLNPLANREDDIINGDFGIWQRGTSFTTFAFGADRWMNLFVGGSVTQSRQAFAVGDALGSNNPTFFLRQTVSGQTLAGDLAAVQQRIESVRSHAGQTITVLGWARRSSGTGNIGISMQQTFGTGGTPSASVTAISPATVTLTGSWAPFAVVVNVPSITGKTLGTNGDDRLDLNIYTSTGATFSGSANGLPLQTIGVDLWGIHTRVGTWTSAATADYRQRDPGTELALCQRYFTVMSATAGINGSYINGYSFPVTMRTAAPAITVISGALASSTWQADSTRFVQINNSTGAIGVGFSFDSEL